jgi:hypothetical protein
MVERVLPDRRTAMTPVALAAAITRTGGRRVEVPYLPPPEPPPRFSRMRRRRGRAWARDSGRARGRPRVGATPGEAGALRSWVRKRVEPRTRCLGCGGARGTSVSRRRRETPRRGALFRVSASARAAFRHQHAPKNELRSARMAYDDVGGRAQRAVVSQSGHGDRWSRGV